MKINVIGAAISGPAAALRLASQGHNVTVYEQRPEDALFSAGILGITHQNWRMLRDYGVNVGPVELPNGFTDYNTGQTTVSPFRYIAWVDLHNALVDVATAYGARFVWEHTVKHPESLTAVTVDATGIAGASRRRLPHQYAGHAIYRGLSPVDSPYDFTAYRQQEGTYFTVGQTRMGSAWAYFVPRPEPATFRTVEESSPPGEYRELPRVFRRIVEGTSEYVVSPLSDWTVPGHMHDSEYRHFRIGDVNGPVRPVTTSGANLAIVEGFNVDKLVDADSFTVLSFESATLERREYDIRLGQQLEAPEIGGTVSDVDYSEHHAVLFPGDAS